VDDVFTRATLEKALEIQNELLRIYTVSGFLLKKWAVNHDNLLVVISNKDRT